MKAHKSALKHGIDEADGIHAAQHHVYAAALDDDHPAREFRLGFDPKGRLLELVVLRFDSGNELLIHAMKARPQYVELLP
ncbi:toxin [Rhodococcus rhodochrous]|uniref:toxin n=1 Tax=Rhodococcus rhodochrous TaxID=1829 RepID=UPI001E2ED547|nr:toxin [Rhodococcus rhodochrous]MCB8914075.1 toxin [Rhodococcus rhodochrous]